MGTGDSVSKLPLSDKIWGWVRGELDRKANIDWAKSEINSLRDSVKDHKRRLDSMTDTLNAVEKNATQHICQKKTDISELQKWKNNFANVKLAVIISVLVLILAGAGQYFSLENSVKNTQIEIKEVKVTVDALQTNQRKFESLVGQQSKQVEERQKEYFDELKQLIEVTLNKAKGTRNR